MANIGIFCGTAGGTSMAIAKALAKEFDVDEIINMEEDFDNVDQLLEYDILNTRPEERIHQFFGDDVSRARRAYRLQRDFDASFSAVAMMLDLIDEVQQLRRQVRHSNFKDA